MVKVAQMIQKFAQVRLQHQHQPAAAADSGRAFTCGSKARGNTTARALALKRSAMRRPSATKMRREKGDCMPLLTKNN